MKIGSKPLSFANIVRKPIQPFIESDAENDSSDF